MICVEAGVAAAQTRRAVRGAWLHVFTDALGSVQAMAAGALIWMFGWNWVDPVASVSTEHTSP